MKPIWILAANSSVACIYEAERARGGLHEVLRLEHPQARMHEQEMTSDLPGRAFDSGGEGRHVMGQQVEPKKEEAIRFARHIGEELEKAYCKGRFGRLYVAASPPFLGLLRQHYSNGVAAVLVDEMGKDLTQLRPDELRSRLPEYL